MEIDLRQMAFATLWKKYEKNINTNSTKEAIRNGDATYKFADYCTVKLDSYTPPAKYSPEDQAKIDKFIADNHIEKQTYDTISNYSIEFVPSERAIKEFNKMLKTLQSSEYKNIAKVADNVAKTINQ